MSKPSVAVLPTLHLDCLCSHHPLTHLAACLKRDRLALGESSIMSVLSRSWRFNYFPIYYHGSTKGSSQTAQNKVYPHIHMPNNLLSLQYNIHSNNNNNYIMKLTKWSISGLSVFNLHLSFTLRGTHPYIHTYTRILPHSNLQKCVKISSLLNAILQNHWLKEIVLPAPFRPMKSLKTYEARIPFLFWYVFNLIKKNVIII